MSNTAIRVAHTADLNGVLKLYQELRPNDPVLDEAVANQTWQQIIDNPHVQIIVADVEGVLASTCALSLNPSITNGARPFGIIEHVITADSHRRMGLGKKTLEFAIDLAWSLNCYKVMLLSGETLHAAHRLYRSVGMQDEIERGFVIKP